MSKALKKWHGILASALQGLFFLLYPLIVYFAYTRLETRALALLLLCLYGVSIAFRFRAPGAELRQLMGQHIGLVLLIGIAAATGNSTLLLVMPVIISSYLCWTFSATLRGGASMIERFARIIEDDLPDFTLPYCRKVTIVWCFFLAANSLCMLILSFAAPIEWWALYSGLISYLLVGVLLGGEVVARKIWFRHFGDGLVDRVFSRLFPPHNTANGRRSLAYQALRERGEITSSSV
jgi:uncharacterized membrane protein